MAWPESFTTDVQQGLLAPFPEPELEWKLQARSKDGTKGMAVCYVDARAVMRRLDQVVGPGNWTFDFDPMNDEGTMIKGRLSLYGVVKCDIGQHTGSDRDEIEKGKSAVSDALKRCAVHFGVGRFLYRLDRKWVPLNERKEIASPVRLTLREITDACRAVGFEGDLGTEETAAGAGSTRPGVREQGGASRASERVRPAESRGDRAANPAAPAIADAAALAPVTHFCSDCGVEVQGVTTGKGPVSAETVVSISQSRWGATLCHACGRQRMEVETANLPTGAIAA